MTYDSIVIGILFAAAVFYLGRKVFGDFFRRETTCAKGCGCNANAPTKPVGAPQAVSIKLLPRQ